MSFSEFRLPPKSELSAEEEVDLDLSPLESTGPHKARVLNHDEIRGILQREIEDALGGLGSQISEQRRRSLRMYQGRPMGNEIKERSQVVMRDVLEVIEWTMPSLMRMFTGGSEVVRFSPVNESGQEAADHATAYLNHLFINEMDGFQILYDWFKTALMEKNGIVKVYWHERKRPVTESWTGLTEDEVLVIAERDGFEPLAYEEREEEIAGQVVKLVDMTARFWKVEKGVAIDGIPPEEFLIARRTIILDDDSPFTAHRKKTTVSELVAMGFDFQELSRVPSDDTPEYSQGRTERLSEDETYPVTTAERTDAASREIWTTDCHIKMDEDGDGYAELRNILIVGEQSVVILDDREENQNPFVSCTPVPMPHKFFGNSLSDLVEDLQVIRSTILRQMLDHTYLTVNPRNAIVEGMVEVEDMLTVRPGGLVRVRATGQIEPVVLPPLPGHVFELLKYLEDVRSNRTGVLAHGSELDASAINQTATGMSAMMAERQQKIEMMARIMAQAMKKLFRKMLKLVVENDTKEQQIEINGQWIRIQPSSWDAGMPLDVEVGLGAGQSVERMGNLGRIMEMQQAHVAGGGLGYTVTPQNLYESGARMTEAAGFKNESLFFTNPQGQEPPPPAPDPQMEKVKADAMKAEAEIKQKVAQLELDGIKERNIAQHRREELEMKERVSLMEIQMRERTALGQQEAMVEAAEISARARNESAPQEAA